MRVRFKIRHPALLLANVLVLLAETRRFPPLRRRAVIEDSTPGARMCAQFFASNPFFVIQTKNLRI